MEKSKILRLLKEYLSLKEERKNLQIEISELKDQKNKNNQEIQVKEKSIQSNNQKLTLTDELYDRIMALKKSIIDLNLIYEDVFLNTFDEEGQVDEFLNDKKINKDDNIINDNKLIKIKKLSEEIIHLIGCENMPHIDNCTLADKKNLEKNYRINYKATMFILIITFVIEFFCGGLPALLGGIFLETIATIALFAILSENYNSSVKAQYNKQLDVYFNKLKDPNKLNQWVLELRKKLFSEIEKEKNNLISTLDQNKLLPTGEKNTLDNYKNYKKQLKTNEYDIFSLKRLDETLNNLINNKNSNLDLLNQKIDNLKGMILIETSNLPDSKEEQDVLEEIKEIDIDLYNEIINEKRILNLKNDETPKLEKGNVLVKTINKKIV